MMSILQNYHAMSISKAVTIFCSIRGSLPADYYFSRERSGGSSFSTLQGLPSGLDQQKIIRIPR